jgi:alcohol dehydrogenase class IV
MKKSFFLEKNVIAGAGSLNRLINIIKKEKYRHILLVTGKLSYRTCGAESIINKIKSAKFEHIEYSGKALPLEHVAHMYQTIKNSEIDLIIGIGGGIILDITKILAFLLSEKISNINDLLKDFEIKNSKEVILIPTTCGSGSEATHFAVIYKDRIKYSIAAKNFKPKYIILDANLMKSLPADLLKISILDSLAQAIESIWAKQATDRSTAYASNAIRLIYKNILRSLNLQKLDEFLLASYYSGLAINISKTTAAHSLSYPLTSYFNIHHGLAVFLVLPEVAKFNYDLSNRENGLDTNTHLISSPFKLLFSLFEVTSFQEFIGKLNFIFKIFNFSNKLQYYGIKKTDLIDIAQKSMNIGRIENNPRTVTQRDVQKILAAIF